jgi:hypothetical protein
MPDTKSFGLAWNRFRGEKVSPEERRAWLVLTSFIRRSRCHQESRLGPRVLPPLEMRTAATVVGPLAPIVYLPLGLCPGQHEPWGRAPRIYGDAYFGFLTFFCWLAWRERAIALKIICFILIMALGNIAMSLCVLMQLFQAKPDETICGLFRQKTA